MARLFFSQVYHSHRPPPTPENFVNYIWKITVYSLLLLKLVCHKRHYFFTLKKGIWTVLSANLLHYYLQMFMYVFYIHGSFRICSRGQTVVRTLIMPKWPRKATLKLMSRGYPVYYAYSSVFCQVIKTGTDEVYGNTALAHPTANKRVWQTGGPSLNLNQGQAVSCRQCRRETLNL